jgi:ParB family transcriptional regulator, chromosome partitioning protein
MAPKFQRRTAAILTGPDQRPEIEETRALHGLSSDFPRLVEIDVDHIRPNPDQPRSVFDEEGLRALARSIEEHGLQQPILVREEAERGRYLLVAGERRWRAHQLLARPTIFAVITKGRPEEVALIENLQRVDLDAVDLARAVSRLIDRHGYTQEAAGSLIGVDRAEVNRRLSVLRLPDDVLEDYRTRVEAVSRSVLVEIAQAEGEGEQRALWERAKAGLTVKALREERKAARAPAGPAPALRVVGRGLIAIGREIDRLEENRTVLVEEHRERLRELQRRITGLLDA